MGTKSIKTLVAAVHLASRGSVFKVEIGAEIKTIPRL